MKIMAQDFFPHHEYKKNIGILCVAACAIMANAAATAVPSDPPSRVGRIGYIEGDVSFYTDRSEGWHKARINFPVTSENSIWTENQSRAEVRIGSSSFRINENSVLDLLKVDDDRTQLFLQRGTLNIRSRADGRENARDSIRVETSSGRFMIENSGRYRIDASQDGTESRISIFAGRARYESNNSGGNADNRLAIDSGKTLIVRSGSIGSATDFRFENANESAFDRWADARDQNWDESHTRYVREQTVSPYMTGYEDLDTYGDWVDDREYGRVWTPRVVASGWAPYRYGSWAYVRPWGWTWVDDAAWGFAPFHYGRWVYARTRWAWWPGDYVRRPVYAPALVGWYGRPGINITISTGPSIGWFPLAPREYYVPSYTNNITYIRNINHITNNITVINPPATYANRMPGTTFVNGNTFVNSRPVQNNTIKVAAKELAEHPIITVAPTAAPFPREMGSRRLEPSVPGRNSNGASMPGRAEPSTATAPSPVPTNNIAAPKNNAAPAAAPGFGKPVPQAIKSGPLPITAPQIGTVTQAEISPHTPPQPSFSNPKFARPAEPGARLPNAANPPSAPAVVRNEPTPRARSIIEGEPNHQPQPRQHKQHVEPENRAVQPAPEGRVQVPQQSAEKPPKPPQPKHEKHEQPAEPRAHLETR